jgi:Ser/Thr protein kinase RdoA (MazF antagonist)
MEADKLALLEQAALRFGADVSRLTPLAGGHMADVYEWAELGRRLVLKIVPAANETEVQHSRSMVDWIAHLVAHGVPTVKPIRSLQGECLELIDFNGGLYFVSASEKLSGRRAEILAYDEWDAPLIRALGQVVGECHAAARTYTPPALAPQPPLWVSGGNCFSPDLTDAEALIVEKHGQALRCVDGLPKDAESWGLIHGDLHFANFMVESATRTIHLFDFDDFAYGWYAMDVAMLVFDWAVVYADHADEASMRAFFSELLAGYRSAKTLSDFWVAQLPAFLKLLEIGVYALVAPHYQPVASDDPWVTTFMRERERRIREDVPYLPFALA